MIDFIASRWSLGYELIMPNVMAGSSFIILNIIIAKSGLLMFVMTRSPSHEAAYAGA
jgi:hypothetical protein